MSESKAQVAPYAYLSDIRHVCDKKEVGSATFSLHGDPSQYTYFWNTGETELQADLPPGTYQFTVINAYGCKQEYEVTILLIESCKIFYKLTPPDYPKNICHYTISIGLLLNNMPINPISSQATIVWNDGVAEGFVRHIFPTQTETEYCFSIFSLSGVPFECCKLEPVCIAIPPRDPNAPVCFDSNEFKSYPPIVNEVEKGKNGIGQYVEILIPGIHDCTVPYDLRGYKIDDNNGELKQGNDFVTDFTQQHIGINPGYLLILHGNLYFLRGKTNTYFLNHQNLSK